MPAVEVIYSTFRMEQEDEEIEQLLGEIPRATSVPLPFRDDTRTQSAIGMTSLGSSSVVYPDRLPTFGAFGFGLNSSIENLKSCHQEDKLSETLSEMSLSSGSSAVLDNSPKLATEFFHGNETKSLGSAPTGLGGFKTDHGLGIYQNDMGGFGTYYQGQGMNVGNDQYLAAALQAQKQQVVLLQLQLEEERQRRQRILQQQYLQQIQDRAAHIYGIQSQALLAAAVAPISPYRAVRQQVHPSRAGPRQGCSMDPAPNHLEALYGSPSLCRYYAQGYCSRGDSCPYVHYPIQRASARSIITGNSEKVSTYPEKILRRGKSPNLQTRKKNGCTNGYEHEELEDYSVLRAEILVGAQDQVPKYTSLKEVEGRIYSIAKDQHGCRFLQRKFDEGGLEDLQKIFDEIIDHIVDLMTDPFGNYLIQKLLEVCSEAQLLDILRVVCTGNELVNISLNMHGTRAVQKLIETLKSPEQVCIITNALSVGIVTLIKDLNGNHVVQRCLQRLNSEDNQFIFDAAADHCVEIATHRHGCCVLQRCVDYAKSFQRERLIAVIASNALILSQDQYGNYVVQYILEEAMWITSEVVARLEGSYAHLAMQKFSSNVVERCLKQSGNDCRAKIVHELITSSILGQLLQDPYGNYVIQCALTNTDGVLHASMVEAIRPYQGILRSSPYGKRILARINLKKA